MIRDDRLPGPLPLSRFRLVFRAQQPYGIRGYRGSAWRGVLGHALKRLVCVTRERNCATCLLRQACTYPYVFETSALRQVEAGARAEAAPHPFVLGVEPLWHNRQVAGETIEFTLIGEHGSAAWGYLIHAFRDGAANGLGVERIPLELVSASQQDIALNSWQPVFLPDGQMRAAQAVTPLIPVMPASVRIRLVTPVRIRRCNDLVEPDRLGFDELIAALLRRLALLTAHHTASGWRMDHRRLTTIAASARVIHRNLRWQDWARYSSRQEQKVPMGGIVGDFELLLEGQEELWPLLWLSQWIHIGKGTSLGLGRVELEAV